jgi:uncharacterized protein (TIGR02646 family)
MMKVIKGAAPKRLTGAGHAATVALKAEYDATTQAFRNGTKKLKFKDAIFGHPTVRNELGRIQHGKCCYCEVKIPVPYALQHVEHYRPKSRSRQSRVTKPLLPGYYWLAYDWDNLFLSCHFCNSPNKSDLFPLADEALRARDHNDPIGQENPLILCPGSVDDPDRHIEYHEEIPKGITIEGTATVEFLGLDSTKHELRLEALGRLRKLRDEIIVLKCVADPGVADMIRERRTELLLAQRPTSQFSMMAKHYLRRNPIP